MLAGLGQEDLMGIDYGGSSSSSSTIINFPWLTGGTPGVATTSGSGPVPTSTVPSSSSSSDPWTAIAAALTGANKIFATRYSVPQLNPGQTIQTGPYGTVMSQQPAGYPASGGAALSSSLGSLSGIIPIVLVVGLLFMFKGK